MKRLCYFLMFFVLILPFNACHIVNPGGIVGTNSDTTVHQSTEHTITDAISTTVPTTVPTTISTEPDMPKELVSEVREDGLLYIPFVINYFYSSRAIALNFSLDATLYPDMEITFDIATNWGKLYYFPDGNNYLEFSHKNGFYVQWLPENYSDYLGKMELIEQIGGAVFVDAVIRADGHIIGYGVFEIGTIDAYEFAVMRSETVIFPMVDGQIQYVTEEYTAERIAELKQTVTTYDQAAKQAEWEAYLESLKDQQNPTEE